MMTANAGVIHSLPACPLWYGPQKGTTVAVAFQWTRTDPYAVVIQLDGADVHERWWTERDYLQCPVPPKSGRAIVAWPVTGAGGTRNLLLTRRVDRDNYLAVQVPQPFIDEFLTATHIYMRPGAEQTALHAALDEWLTRITEGDTE